MTPATFRARSAGTARRPSRSREEEAHPTKLSGKTAPGRFELLAMTTAIALLIAFSALGQTPPAEPARPAHPPDYSKEAFIVERMLTGVSFENDGTGTHTTTAQVRVQSEAGVQQWGVLNCGYSTVYEEVAIGYVRVRKADGTVLETPASNVQDMTSDVTRVAPMYTDFHEKHVAVKGLSVGDVLEYQFVSRTRTPLIPGHFWFSYDFSKTSIVLDEEVEVSVPKEREVKLKSPDLKPEVREEGSKRVYTWKTANRLRKDDEEAPHQIPPPAILISTFKSWEDVGQWWRSLAQDRAAPTPEVGAKADELTRGATTREEKVGAVYNYVATHFRYISISLGIGRYQPHAAIEVLNNEYGDCKDKHTLLASLLAAADIEAYPALMNSARQIDPDVPSPGQFDHVITVVPTAPHGNKLIWLDTTTEVAPFGFLTFNLRNKQALVISSALPAALVTTPVAPPFKSFQTFEIDAKLGEDGVLEGKAQRTYRGDLELLMRTAFRQVAQAQWKELAQRVSQANGFAGDVSDVEAAAPEATNEPYHFSYKYTRKDYPDWANHRISPPVGFLGFGEIKNDKKPTQPILLGPVQEMTAIAKVELPKGYKPLLLPRVDLVRDFAEYHATYTFKDGVFVTEVHELIKKTEVPLSALADYKSFQQAVSDDLDQYTGLSNGAEPYSALTPSANAEVNDLADQARQAVERRDLEGASDLLQRALKLDEHYKDGWVILAQLRMIQGRPTEGISDLRKAISVDPHDSRLYTTLAAAYMHLQRPDDAVQVWQDLIKEDPADQDAHRNLGNTLFFLKRYREAVPELEAAMAGTKPSPVVQVTLGNAYLGVGNTEKAAAILKQAAESATEPTIWNDVAYALADHKLNLPDAQRLAEKAVRSEEDDSTHVSLAKLEADDLNRMNRLAAFWDTLGWVYFQQGEFPKAQKYVEASWSLYQSGDTGEHLAQVYEKQGMKAAATHERALARAAPGSGYGLNASQTRGLAIPPPGQLTAAEELSQMRRTKLGKLSAHPGSAEFYVLIAPGGAVEDVKFISGDEQIRPLAKALGSLKFKAPLPDEAPVKLVRRGILTCGTYVYGTYGCDFTLFTLDMVRFSD